MGRSTDAPPDVDTDTWSSGTILDPAQAAQVPVPVLILVAATVPTR